MKLAIGLPWYMGPDDNTFPMYFDHMLYYGALRERTLWRDALGHEMFMSLISKLPPLDELNSKDGLGDPTEADWNRLGRLEIGICNYSRTSLVGLARERVVDQALDWGADYLLWWDSDMLFPHSSFLQLWRHDKPVIGALAFTARPPFHPVIFRIRERFDTINNMRVVEGSDIVLDYPKDQLIGNAEIGGELAMGGGLTLYNLEVFSRVPKPWFSSTGCGEDWHFCYRCKDYGVERFIDTSVKTSHKEHQARWVSEDVYWKEREVSRDSYVELFGNNVRNLAAGGVVVSSLGGAV